MNEIACRVEAVKATRAHFDGRPFEWGRVDCARIAAWHLRQMGHKGALGLAKAGSYHSALGAKRALKRLGCESLAEALAAAGLVEVAPAAAWVGDVWVQPGSDGLDAVGIVYGNQRLFGFIAGEYEKGAQVLDLTSMENVRAFRL